MGTVPRVSAYFGQILIMYLMYLDMECYDFDKISHSEILRIVFTTAYNVPRCT
jgi:hypothetical protein